MKARQHLSAVASCAPRSRYSRRLSKRSTGLQYWTPAVEGRRRQAFHAKNSKTTAACRCPESSLLHLDTLQLRSVAALLLFLCFSVHQFAAAAAYFPHKQSEQPKSATTSLLHASGSWEGIYGSAVGTSSRTRESLADQSAANPPLFHIVWPEQPLDLDSMLRHAAEHLKVPWGKKVLAGRLAALTVDEADDFCGRIKFAVTKHLRSVFDASSHFKIFEGMPTTTPFLHLEYVRDFLHSQFTRDKIKLSLPDRELERLFKHAGGLPWRRNTDAKHVEAQMYDYAEGDDNPPKARHSRSLTDDEL